jgi:hypothetical protein
MFVVGDVLVRDFSVELSSSNSLWINSSGSHMAGLELQKATGLARHLKGWLDGHCAARVLGTSSSPSDALNALMPFPCVRLSKGGLRWKVKKTHLVATKELIAIAARQFPTCVEPLSVFQTAIMTAFLNITGDDNVYLGTVEGETLSLCVLGIAAKWRACVQYARRLARRSDSSRNVALQELKELFIIQRGSKESKQALQDLGAEDTQVLEDTQVPDDTQMDTLQDTQVDTLREFDESPCDILSVSSDDDSMGGGDFFENPSDEAEVTWQGDQGMEAEVDMEVDMEELAETQVNATECVPPDTVSSALLADDELPVDIPEMSDGADADDGERLVGELQDDTLEMGGGADAEGGESEVAIEAIGSSDEENTLSEEDVAVGEDILSESHYLFKHICCAPEPTKKVCHEKRTPKTGGFLLASCCLCFWFLLHFLSRSRTGFRLRALFNIVVTVCLFLASFECPLQNTCLQNNTFRRTGWHNEIKATSQGLAETSAWHPTLGHGARRGEQRWRISGILQYSRGPWNGRRHRQGCSGEVT